ncbi:NAD(P)H-hydrate epimerase [Candidatus Curtissbacteria bacterium]|nr:NAD(P)H-hydrate epimerase [Candidatus Curtissbacteria bacterium]
MNQFASRDQVSSLDRIAIEDFGIDILQMMEIAGSSFARIVKNFLKDLNHKHILVLSGAGNNGGDGLAAARYLANWGSEVKVILAKTDLKPAAKHQLAILEKMGIESTVSPVKLLKADLVVDALLGYNQIGTPKPPYDDLITQANGMHTPIFAFDNPSGLDIDSGNPSYPTIRAHTTITLAAIKKGLVAEVAKEYVGNIELVDLGIPRIAYEKTSLDYPFDGSNLLN